MATGKGAYNLGCFLTDRNNRNSYFSYGYSVNLELVTYTSEYMRIDGTKFSVNNNSRYRAVP